MTRCHVSEARTPLKCARQPQKRQADRGLQLWKDLAATASTLDVLSSFASFAASADGPTCVPVFVPPPAAGAVFDAEGMWHPALALANGRSPVGSTLRLGGAAGGATALLLTGPNMVRLLCVSDRRRPM